MNPYKILAHSESFKFLLIGLINTLFGFFFSIILFRLLKGSHATALIAVLANLLSIIFSFVMYKLFVFSSKGNWFLELIRCFIVYLNIFIINVILMTVLVDVFFWSVWISQLCVTFLAAFLSYVSHKKFTFKKN
jgi:putative flippase GtrA